MKEGLFIVIYGINNLGKSTQAEMLVDSLTKAGLTAEYIKYPIYDLKPTGPKINEILRGGHKQMISEIKFQTLYAQNRLDFQAQLCKKISDGINIVAEDYVGTGLAWGWSKGANLDELIKINRGLLVPDVAILLDGERFLQAQEKMHQHESNQALMTDSRKKHLKLAARFGWQVINANQEPKDVQQEILAVIEKKVKQI